jgi:hypothetical protein
MQVATISASTADTEDRNAVMSQRFRPNLLRPRQRLGAGANFCYAIELEQRSEVGRLSKLGIGHVTPNCESQASLTDSPRRDGLDLDHEIRPIQF